MTTEELEDFVAEERSPPKIHRWTVLRCHPAGLGEITRQVYETCGTVMLDSAYGIYSNEAVDRIANIGGGPGEYLCFIDERLVRLTIVAETVYRKVDP